MAKVVQADDRDSGLLAQGGEASAARTRGAVALWVVENTKVSSRSTPLAHGCCEDGVALHPVEPVVVVGSRQTVLTPASLFGGPTMRSPSTRVIARWMFTVPW